jgi:hypothetical protein
MRFAIVVSSRWLEDEGVVLSSGLLDDASMRGDTGFRAMVLLRLSTDTRCVLVEK